MHAQSEDIQSQFSRKQSPMKEIYSIFSTYFLVCNHPFHGSTINTGTLCITDGKSKLVRINKARINELLLYLRFRKRELLRIFKRITRTSVKERNAITDDGCNLNKRQNKVYRNLGTEFVKISCNMLIEFTVKSSTISRGR